MLEPDTIETYNPYAPIAAYNNAYHVALQNQNHAWLVWVVSHTDEDWRKFLAAQKIVEEMETK